MTTYVETIIIGGGQAGLAVSYYLTQNHRRHIVLEQAAAAADAWRNRLWESFTLNMPNWQSIAATIVERTPSIRSNIAYSDTRQNSVRDPLVSMTGILSSDLKDRLPFTGNVALITGGTTGIGATTAKRVAELGANVIITGRRRDRGCAVADEIVQKGGSAQFLQADLAIPEEVRNIVPFVVKTFGRLDYAFNNAATAGSNVLLVDQTDENFDRMFSVNVKALFIVLQDEIRQMLRQGASGSIVNAASVSGLVATPTAGHYVASKHAVLGLTKTAAIEYGQYGIRVNAVSPGSVRTDMLLQVFGSEQAIDRLAAVHPLGRIGNPEEIADAVIWLFSDNSSYYTGQSLTLDGGLTAQRPVTGQPVRSDNGKSPALASPFRRSAAGGR